MRSRFQFHLVTCLLVLLGAMAVVAMPSFSRGPAIDDVGPTTVVGRVVDVDGKAVSQATVTVQSRLPASVSTATVQVTTDVSGGFTVEVSGNPIAFQQWKIVANTSDGSQAGFFRYSGLKEATVDSKIEIKVEPTKAYTINVVVADSKPVADAQVAIQFGYPHLVDGLRTDADGKISVYAAKSERVDAVIAWKDGVGFDYEVYALGRDQKSDLKTAVPEFPGDGETLRLDGASPVTVNVVDTAGEPIEGVRLYPWILRKESANRELNLSYFTDAMSQSTDASGATTFAWMPKWQTSGVTIWPTADGYTRTRANYDPAVDVGELTVTLDQLVTIRGRVLDPAGEPAGGIAVHATGEGYGWDGGRDVTKSADDGTYELQVPPEQVYMVTASNDDWVADAVPSFVVNSGKPVEGIDLTLRKPTRLTGLLTAEPSGEALKNERVIVYQFGDDLGSITGASIANPENSRRYVRPMAVNVTKTDYDGRFEFLLGNGSYDIRPPRQEKAEEFDVSGEAALTIDVTTEIQAKIKLTGVVRHQEDDRPLSGIRLSAVSQRFRGDDWQALTDKDGTFAVERLGEPTYVLAMNDDKSLGAVSILPGDQSTLEMKLEKTGSAFGVLHKTDSAEPAAAEKIRFGIRIPDENNQTWSNRFGGLAVTDSEGRFRLEGLVPGWEYDLNLESRPDGSIPSLKSITIVSVLQVDMGAMNIPAPRKPYVPPTLDERIAGAMGVKGSAQERFDRAIPRCRINKQKLLIVLGKPDEPQVRQFMGLRYEDSDFRKIRDDFLIMALSTEDPAMAADVEKLFEGFDARVDEESMSFSLALVDADGDLIAHSSEVDLIEQDELSKDAVIEWLRSHLDEPIDAKKLLSDTLAKAKKENKRVLVQETAAWCGPCHLLSDYLDGNRAWEADYLWIKMDHRFTGAREIMVDLRDGSNGGIPWFAILDANGEKLATSNHFESGDNIGFPSSQHGQTHFKKMLLDTKITMSEDEISALVERLKKDE
ncbi:carboxypeptidase-like regulatory domain-containing protein [Rubripirellula reticaptiva]|uniref:Bacterial Ig-like domain (Group 1) n=1 Tax=Rubripirellula reticaptiva TaxID=2528013 RepID=A0A5C6EL20_9BACT|nr:carboxypeptidase-like regulatory domain-containing protein [Rubripirellula reticaptiva]TWU49852.1 Bacterial Ig-like domain (group 1) [Rubripirellula reticaptiva]